MKLQDRYDGVLRGLHEAIPRPETELQFGSTFQLLVAVILSAQCTDKRVNMVTPALFRRFPTAEAMAEGTSEEVYELIRSVSYPNNKTRSLLGMARKVVSDYAGRVPDDPEELVKLPGVGRKTANVMVAVAFAGQAMPVDTHVFRVSRRIGLTPMSTRTPLQTERILTRHIAGERLSESHHLLLLHGRYTCTALRPRCGECSIRDFCRHYERRQRGQKG